MLPVTSSEVAHHTQVFMASTGGHDGLPVFIEHRYWQRNPTERVISGLIEEYGVTRERAQEIHREMTRIVTEKAPQVVEDRPRAIRIRDEEEG